MVSGGQSLYSGANLGTVVLQRVYSSFRKKIQHSYSFICKLVMYEEDIHSLHTRSGGHYRLSG